MSTMSPPAPPPRLLALGEPWPQPKGPLAKALGPGAWAGVGLALLAAVAWPGRPWAWAGLALALSLWAWPQHRGLARRRLDWAQRRGRLLQAGPRRLGLAWPQSLGPPPLERAWVALPWRACAWAQISARAWHGPWPGPTGPSPEGGTLIVGRHHGPPLAIPLAAAMGQEGALLNCLAARLPVWVEDHLAPAWGPAGPAGAWWGSAIPQAPWPEAPGPTLAGGGLDGPGAPMGGSS